MAPADGATLHRRDFLLTVAEELGDLGASATALQAMLGAMLDGAGGIEAQDMWRLQEIDRLQQTLDDLAAILRCAAEDEGQRLDIGRLVAVARLGALRERLRGQQAAPCQDAGVVAMF